MHKPMQNPHTHEFRGEVWERPRYEPDLWCHIETMSRAASAGVPRPGVVA